MEEYLASFQMENFLLQNEACFILVLVFVYSQLLSNDRGCILNEDAIEVYSSPAKNIYFGEACKFMYLKNGPKGHFGKGISQTGCIFWVVWVVWLIHFSYKRIGI